MTDTLSAAGGELRSMAAEADLELSAAPDRTIFGLDGQRPSGLSYVRLLDLLEQSQQEIRRLEQIIHIDELCGIGNRRAFNREMERAQALCERHGLTCHLALIDVNDFKGINDGHGHAAGDFVLAQLAVLLKANIRQADALCRLGGDEFAVIFYGICDADLSAKAARLKRIVADTAFDFAGRRVPVSISIGTAPIGEDIAASFGAADRAMYRDKRGRETA